MDLRVDRFRKWAGSLYSTYTHPIGGEWDNIYYRGDVKYRGESVTGATNLAFTGDYSLVNARLEKEDLRLELYIKNLFDEDSWVGGWESSDFTAFGDRFLGSENLGISLIPQDKRTFGFRASYSF